MSLSAAVSVYIKFFFLLTPFFILAVFLALTEKVETRMQRALAGRVTVGIVLTSILLFLFGETIFDLFGITVDSFRIGAGALLFLSAVSLKYWGPFAGFLSGWNYWGMFVLVGMAELTAAGIYMQYWLPDVHTWIWAAAFFVIINAVNLVNVRLYGETEFWFALIKVLAIIGSQSRGGAFAVCRKSCGG